MHALLSWEISNQIFIPESRPCVLTGSCSIGGQLPRERQELSSRLVPGRSTLPALASTSSADVTQPLKCPHLPALLFMNPNDASESLSAEHEFLRKKLPCPYMFRVRKKIKQTC